MPFRSINIRDFHIMPSLNHISKDGSAKMVDVSSKEPTYRTAIAIGKVIMKPETLKLIKEKNLPKGEVLNTARIAGILSAKRTHELIPMCHPLPISWIDIQFEFSEEDNSILIQSEVRVTANTGVEMEALTAVSVSALTIYDMCKAVDKTIVISDIKLLKKTGGKSGEFELLIG